MEEAEEGDKRKRVHRKKKNCPSPVLSVLLMSRAMFYTY